MRIFITISLLLITICAEAQIDADFSIDTNKVCVGYPVAFTDLSVSDTLIHWLWDFGDGQTDSLQNPVHVYASAGFYTVSLTASNQNFSDTESKVNYIQVREKPDVSLIFSNSQGMPSYYYLFVGTVNNNDGSSYQYNWSFNSQVLTDTTDTIIYILPGKGENMVTLMVESGAGCADTLIDTIVVSDEFLVPDVFTPNGDGINDVYTVKTNGLDTYTFTVYNRWGAVLFTMTARRISWDGRSSAGVSLPSGTYFYEIYSETNAANKKNGVVQLYR